MSALLIHQGFARVLLFYSAITGIWGLFLYFRGRNPTGGYLGALIINEGVAILQGLLGLLLRVTGSAPHDPLHYLYGAVAVLTLPAAYFMSDGGRQRRDSLVFGLAGVLLVGIALRGIMTGSD